MPRIENREKFILSQYKIFIFLSLFIISLIAIFFIYGNNLSSYFNNIVQSQSEKYGYVVKSIEITGTKKIKKSQMISKISNNYNKSIFLVSLSSIKKNLNKSLWIDGITLKFDYPSIIGIIIKEKEPIAILENENKYFYLDDKGSIIEELANIENIDDEKLVVIKGLYSAKNTPDLIKMLDLYPNINLKYAEYIGSRRWDLILDNTLRVKLAEVDSKFSLKELSKLLNKLEEFDFSLIEFIDLRLPDKTIIRFYDEKNIQLLDENQN